jgi:hypothetical protein
MRALQQVNIVGDDDGSTEMVPRSNEQNRHTTSVNVPDKETSKFVTVFSMAEVFIQQLSYTYVQIKST